MGISVLHIVIWPFVAGGFQPDAAMLKVIRALPGVLHVNLAVHTLPRSHLAPADTRQILATSHISIDAHANADDHA